MNSGASETLPFGDGPDLPGETSWNEASLNEGTGSKDETTTPGGRQEGGWKIVAKTPGLIPAKIIAGRLQAAGYRPDGWPIG